MNSKLWKFVAEYGDLASVAGLLLSTVGFALTIWSARGAKKAADETRKSVERIKLRLLRSKRGILYSDLEECLRVLRSVSQTSNKGFWAQSFQSCEELLAKAGILTGNVLLIDNEVRGMRVIVDDLQLIRVEFDRMRKKTIEKLPEEVTGKLGDMIAQFSQIQGRLQKNEDSEDLLI